MSFSQCVEKKKSCHNLICLEDRYGTFCFERDYSFTELSPPAVVNFDIPEGFTVTPLPESNTQCPETHFQCRNDGYCLPVYVRCNDMIDCPDHEDEVDCKNYKTCPGYYRCRDSYKTICAHVNHLCDGVPQCPLHDDELMCDTTCPSYCVCYGFAFTCNHTFLINSFPQVRYLDALGSGIRLSDVTHNTMLIHLGVQSCGWRQLTEVFLPNLHSLDLSMNLLHSVNFSHFGGMPQLRRLNMAGNPISGRSFNVPKEYVYPLIMIFNISHVQANSLNMTALSAVMPKLQGLDLSRNDIQALQGQRLFPNLQFLNLRSCPITDFAPDFLKHMTDLVYVFADNFKLCCPVVLPDNFRGNCFAPFDDISSCDDLLGSKAYRFALPVFAVFAVLGNLGCSVYHLCLLSESTKTGFVIFVLHLWASEILMGVYLVFIGIADQMYAGDYIWNETSWKQSPACSIAGFVSLLSSEVSTFLVGVITLDRFLVLHFPFSHIRFGARSAHIASCIIWALGLSLVMVPLLPLTSHWEFFHQTSICIPLPVTRAEFPGHIYSFSIMTVCNLSLSLMIGVSQFLIHQLVRSNSASKQLANAKDSTTENPQSKETTVARRFLSVAVSNCLCWFPIGLCGVLAASGVVIPGEVNVGMAIFVFPLNSALNPFLYTLNIVLEKRRKAQEVRFQKLFRAHKSGCA